MNSNYVLGRKFDFYPQFFAFHMLRFQISPVVGSISPFIGIKSGDWKCFLLKKSLLLWKITEIYLKINIQREISNGTFHAYVDAANRREHIMPAV